MSNLTSIPLIDAFETTLAQERDGATGTVYLDTAPGFTFPSGYTTAITVNPGKTIQQVALINAVDTSVNTVTVSSIGVNKGASVAYTQQTHPIGSVVKISNPYHFWDHLDDVIRTKLDSDGGNTTTTFDLSVSGSSFRIRLDAGDMKFTDDNQSEVSLSTIAIGSGGTDEKIKISNNDTTSGYLNGKLTGGDGITLTEANDASNETLDIDIDTTDTNIFVTTATASKIPKTDATNGYLRSFINSQSTGLASTTEPGLIDEKATDAEAKAGTASKYEDSAQVAKYGSLCNIVTKTLSFNAANTTTTIAHGLGRIPKGFLLGGVPTSNVYFGHASYDIDTTTFTQKVYNNKTAALVNYFAWYGVAASYSAGWAITGVDATDITLTYTNTTGGYSSFNVETYVLVWA